MQRIPFGLLLLWPAFGSVLAVALVRLRCAAGDERRQLVDVGRRIGAGRRRGVLLARIVGLRVARWIRLRLARSIDLRIARRKGLPLARHIGLRVVSPVARLASHRRRAVVLAVVECLVAPPIAFRPVERLILAILLLRGGNQAKVMLGVLVIIFRRDRIAGGLRIAGELDVFFRDMRCGTADFHIGTVRLV